MKKIFKILTRIFWMLLILLAVLFGVSKIMEDKIVALAVESLNEHLAVPVYVDEISFSLIKNFPHASVHLKNFTVRASSNTTDTLMHVKDLSLSLNTRALLQKELKISQINVNQGFLKYGVDKNGESTFKLFKSNDSSPSENKESLALDVDLDKVKFKQVRVYFYNHYKDVYSRVYTSGFSVSGFLKGGTYGLVAKGPLEIEALELGDSGISSSVALNVNSELQYRNDTLFVQQGGFSLKNAKLEASGFIALTEKPWIDLKLKGQNLRVEHVLKNVKAQHPLLQAKNLGGLLNLNGSLVGYFTEKRSPAIQADLSFSNGYLNVVNHNLSFHKIQINGKFSNGKKRSLETSSFESSFFNAQIDSSFVNGRISIRNIIKPTVKLDALYYLKIKDINNFVNSEKLTVSGDQIKGGIKVSGRLNLKAKSLQEQVKGLNYQLSAALNEVNFSSGPVYKFSNITGNLNINPGNVTAENLSVNYKNTTLSFNGYTSNPLIFAQKTPTTFFVEGEAIANRMNYQDLLPLFDSGDSEEASGPDVNINIQLLCDAFEYNKINASQVSAQIQYKKKELLVNDLNFYAFEGRVNSSIKYYPIVPGQNFFYTATQTNGVDVNQLFKAFDNFGQKSLTSDNLYGFLNTNFDCEFKIKNGKVDSKSIDLLGHIALSDGKLINFEPLQSLSSFSEIDELKHVTFKTLENDLLIAHEYVHIPQMEIKSNAFDLTLFGKQAFNGNYEYHAKIFLSDFIGGKAKRLRKQQSEYGYIEDAAENKSALYLLATHENGKSRVRLDKSGLRKRLKEEYQDQKSEIKRLLSTTGSKSTKDTTKLSKQESTEFEIEWDEE